MEQKENDTESKVELVKINTTRLSKNGLYVGIIKELAGDRAFNAILKKIGGRKVLLPKAGIARSIQIRTRLLKGERDLQLIAAKTNSTLVHVKMTVHRLRKLKLIE